MSSRDDGSWWDKLLQHKWWVIGAAVVGLAVMGGLAVKMGNEEKEAEAERKKCAHRVRHSFAKHKHQIIDYLYNASWNEFDYPTLKKIYTNFAMHCVDKNKGLMEFAVFQRLVNQCGLSDPAIVQSLYRVWNTNDDGMLDFIELVEGLECILTGTKAEKLRRFFKMYDIDNNGSISPGELERLLHAFFPAETKAELSADVKALFALADRNRNHSISEAEFVSLAAEKRINFKSADEFNAKFAALFGLDVKDFKERDF